MKPYLPDKKVTVFIADTSIPDATVITPPSIEILPPSMQKHADLGIVIISSKKAVCPPESYAYYKNALSSYGFEIIKGNSHIGCHYPMDSAYNVGIVGKKCFLNKKVCDKLLFDILISEGYKIIEVNQGYAKCSICPIDENSFITGDVSIARAGKKAGMDVLLISNEGITLSGYKNGFFGGCCGMAGNNELLVNGDLSTLSDYKNIEEYLSAKDIAIKSLREGDVIDIGSIIPLMTS